jgi:Transposase IS200 like
MSTPLASYHASRLARLHISDEGTASPDFSLRMNGPSALRAVLKNGILSIWTSHNGHNLRLRCATSSGVQHGGPWRSLAQSAICWNRSFVRWRQSAIGGRSNWRSKLVMSIYSSGPILACRGRIFSGSSRAVARAFCARSSHLRKLPSLWTRCFLLSLVGQVSQEMIQKYIEKQGKTKVGT